METTEEYWDCECRYKYIHPSNRSRRCPVCKATRDTSPDSRVDEIAPAKYLIFTNDLRKGDRVRLSNGWEAEVMDNRKGNLRCLKVFGYFTDTGDNYAMSIVSVLIDGNWIPITLTESQKVEANSLHLQGWL